jgi:epsilon-lactone hydrolase
MLPIAVASRSMMRHVADRGVPAMLTAVRTIGRLSEPMTRFPPTVAIVPGRVGDVAGSWVTPVGAPHAPVILYLHGGAFVTPLGGPFRMVAAHIGLSAGLRVFVPDYRILPEHVYPAAHEDCFSVYRDLVEQKLAPVLVGDSTGGVLALAMLLRARQTGLPQPPVCVLLSPTVDYGFRDQGILRAKDAFVHPTFVLTGHAGYVNGNDTSLPDLGPVYQDLRGLAPIHVLVGEHEILRTETDRLTQAAQQQGVAIAVRTWPGMWHGWYVMADRLPEGRRALAEAGRLIRTSTVA